MDGKPRMTAEEIELSHAVALIRQMIRDSNDLRLLDKIYNGLNVAIGESVDKRYDIRRLARRKQDPLANERVSPYICE